MSWDRIVGEWYLNDLLGHKGELPSSSFGIFYTKCLMDIIAADGVISDKQRNWVISFAAISGYPDEVILQIAKYDPNRDKEGVQILQSDMDEDYVKLSRLSLIYNAFRAAGSDGEIHEKQAEAISALGRRLGATIEEIQKVRLLYDEEIQLRKKRAAVLVPKRLNTVVSELKHANAECLRDGLDNSITIKDLQKNMRKCCVFLFIIVTIQLMSVNGERRKKKDDDALCLTASILCVQNVSLEISKTAKNVSKMVSEIEISLRKKEIHDYELQGTMNRIGEKILSYSDYPSSNYYTQFSLVNNIRRNDLVLLFTEAHDAVYYLYISIKNLLVHSLHDHELDELFGKILENLQFNMLCKYRNILHVYSEKWRPIYSTNGIQLSKTRKRAITSIEYRSYAIIISQLSRQWMEKIENVIINLGNKLI